MTEDIGIKPARSTETAIAVFEVQMKNLEGKVTDMLTQGAANHVETRRDIQDIANDIKNNFVTKDDHKSLNEKVDKIADNLSWVVKIIIGAVVVAVLGLVIAKGGVSVPTH